MLERIEVVVEFADYPFAIYQEQICIFEHGIKDSDTLQAFSKNFWQQTDVEHLSLNYFRGYIFLSKKFILDDTYLLTLFFKEKEGKNWSQEQWDGLFRKVQAYVAILSDTSKLSIRRVDHKGFSYHHPDESQDKLLYGENQIDFADNYQFEKNFFQSLKNGNTLQLNRMVQNLSKINRTKLSTDFLTGQKYRFVSLVTLVTRTSINYGCPPTLAYRLSDKLIRELDTVKHIQDFTPLINQLVNEFSLLIKTRAVPPSSIVVKQTVQYIYQHLYEDLSNTLLAEEINVHPAYLSTIFKKETGISLRTFINTVKINEAKYLLSETDLSFKEISEALHFSNQSYFCKLFKEQTSYTPKEYRILF